MISPRDFLVRGLLAGLLAGFVAFGVAYVAGEPAVDAAIAIEESGTATTGTTNDGTTTDGSAPGQTHEHAEGTAEHSHDAAEAVVPRSLQSTLGLLTGTVVTGVTLGGLVGVLAALALGRIGGLTARGSTLLIAGTGFVAVYLMPFVAYPPNPPAVGQADTIGYRTTLYFTALAISVVAAVAAVVVGAQLRARIGGWYAGLAAGAGYLLVVGVAIALLPTYDEVPAGFPAELLYGFRGASLLTQLSLWAVLGLTLAELVHRRVQRLVPARSIEPSRV